MKTLINFLFIVVVISGTQGQESNSDSENFSFAFMTDIHLQNGRNALEGFNQAIDTLNKLNPDFLLTGGDLLEHETMGQADTMYRLYVETCNRIDMPIHNTMGNHDITGGSSGKMKLQDCKKMYKQYLGDSYYSFAHKGWHFMVLDAFSIFKDSVGNFIHVSLIDSIQIEWIKNDLAQVDTLTPIAICSHVPFLNSKIAIAVGFDRPIPRHAIINNTSEVLELFNKHNLKLVLQGHLHNLDDVNLNKKTRFITGGAVSAQWWEGPTYSEDPIFKLEEGFLMVHIINDEISWDYIDFNWEVKNN